MGCSHSPQFRLGIPCALRTRRGQTLIGLLVVIAILAVLAVIMVPKIAGRHHEPGQPLTPRERGYQAACGIYEAQINQAIMMYRQDRNHNPPNLEALKQYGLTDDMIHAPDCVFQYDPQTGIARNAAEGAQGVGGVVNPTSSDQQGSNAGAPTAAQSPAAAPYASHSITPPGATQSGGQGSGGPGFRGNRGNGPNMPGGLHMPNISGGMGAGGSDGSDDNP